jgi:RNA-directed DNA polymerase
MTKRQKQPPATVPLAQQAGAEEDHAIRSRWRLAASCVWTVRMLTALEQGAKGTKWFRLIDKVYTERNLLAGFQQVTANDGAAGVDHVTCEDFARRLPDSLWEIVDLLKSGRYVPQAIRRVHIPKPGTHETRPLGIPTVRDRVVQAAIVNVIEPIFERDFAEHSYGFRPGRGCKDALRRVDRLLKQGYVHVVDADLKGYFDSIPHDRLMSRVEEKIADGPLLRLVESFLKADILDETSRWTPEAGAPQGAVLSPLLSNIYLDPLDHLLAQSGFAMVRYADDFVILCRTAEDAARALQLVEHWVADNGLTLHPTKTRLVDVRSESFDFLGYTFRGQKHWPRKKSMAKLKDTVRQHTRRTSGDSLHSIVRRLNPMLRGWFEYFQHSSYANVFRDLDGWIRRRLRSILRRRAKRRGLARGSDNPKWPIAYFAELGLYSLAAARASVRQPSRR